ncbi:hypothetical protein N7451_006512 [Penicillium sp. IBT 35674x]|nr:hypothetical protein N7451_006512 [Penicillium sp. IBT 35674x]
MPPAEKATHTRRYRSAVACQACRQRKVRCSWSITGVPCAGCAQDGSQCIVDKKTKSIEIAISAKTGSQISTHHEEHSSVSAPLDSTTGIDYDPAGDTVNGSQIDFMRIDFGQSAPDFSNIDHDEGDRSDRTAKALGQQRRIGETYFYTGKKNIVSVIQC